MHIPMADKDIVLQSEEIFLNFSFKLGSNKYKEYTLHLLPQFFFSKMSAILSEQRGPRHTLKVWTVTANKLSGHEMCSGL